MNTGEGLGDDRFNTQVQGHQCCVLTRGALAVVGAADDDAFALGFNALREALIAHAEAELTQVRNVGTIGQDLGACRHNVVSGDIVAHFQHSLSGNALRQRFGLGKGLMLGPRSTSTLSASSGLAGDSIILSLMVKCSGISTVGASPRSRGSVR